ncbi:uncharacterized protein LOC130758572 isoform X2 [Actinidia eriantha]|nr:uncharacterized protein LOC130758572 isoform X2 [Actinidia eriantha]XP_057469502.1 uncharacterized protein LOC130758572 isoform X2 [Actinidia eriantha]XP_057469503.1 uncharacterized protein LOC130758572 isoform X2 [Actinidia eriantha]XP_057469504.1 uncharacterized protein LOC130758572 isoform X2 [Actinidia eriantha]XP_057469505.1 uncharacterized protein LOC130758572 isoform X2 [Actinidia eriantha]
MNSRHLSGNKSYADNGNGDEPAVSQPSKEVILGDIIWVSLHGSSWWPAQVVDDNAVSQSKKPSNRSASEVLVRLYGSYKYMYVDPMACRTEFENILEQNNGNCNVIFKKALDEELARFESGGAEVEESKPQELTARRIRVMQRLGLIAPTGSPFHRNGHIPPNLSLCN